MVDLSPRRVDVTRGVAPLEATISIHNAGRVVDQCTLDVIGLDPSWVSLATTSVALFPGDSERVAVTFHPPQQRDLRAGTYPFQVVVRSRTQATEQRVEGVLEIHGQPAYQLDLIPQRQVTGGQARYQLVIRNTGSADGVLLLEARDTEAGCEFRFPRDQEPRIPAGASVEVPLIVRPRHRPWLGRGHAYDFVVTAGPPDEPGNVHSLAGHLTYQPRVVSLAPLRSLLMALLLVAAAAVGLAAVPAETRCPLLGNNPQIPLLGRGCGVTAAAGGGVQTSATAGPGSAPVAPTAVVASSGGAGGAPSATTASGGGGGGGGGSPALAAASPSPAAQPTSPAGGGGGTAEGTITAAGAGGTGGGGGGGGLLVAEPPAATAAAQVMAGVDATAAAAAPAAVATATAARSTAAPAAVAAVGATTTATPRPLPTPSPTPAARVAAPIQPGTCSDLQQPPPGPAPTRPAAAKPNAAPTPTPTRRPVNEWSQSEPTAWWYCADVPPDQVSQLLASRQSRLVDLEVEQVQPTVLLSVVAAANRGAYARDWWWYFGLDDTQVQERLTTNHARPISLQAYPDVGGDTRFAVVMVANNQPPDARTWSWFPELVNAQQIDHLASTNKARPIDVDPYLAAGERRYAVVLYAATGLDQVNTWRFDNLTVDQVNQQVAATKGWIFDIQPNDVAAGTFDVLIEACPCAKNWWAVGLDDAGLASTLAQTHGRIVSLATYQVNGTRRYAVALIDNT